MAPGNHTRPSGSTRRPKLPTGRWRLEAASASPKSSPYGDKSDLERGDLPRPSPSGCPVKSTLKKTFRISRTGRLLPKSYLFWDRSDLKRKKV